MFDQRTQPHEVRQQYKTKRGKLEPVPTINCRACSIDQNQNSKSNLMETHKTLAENIQIHTFMNRAFSFNSSTQAGTHEDKALKTLSTRLNRYRGEEIRRKIAKGSAECEQVEKKIWKQRDRESKLRRCIAKCES